MPWKAATADLTPDQREEFREFVMCVDPNALTDADRLKALRVMYALSKDPRTWPWPPSSGSR